MSSDALLSILAAGAPDGLTSIALHASGDAALTAAIRAAATAGRGTVVTLQHPATPIEGAVAALSPYCYRCPIGLAYPTCEIACVESLEKILLGLPEATAAVVIEPAAQVAGGMITAPPGHLRRVRDLCDARGALLIADERATGGGRSGFLWAVTRDAVTPDVLVAGETIAGGAAPIGATLSREPVETGDPSAESVAEATAWMTRVTAGIFLGEARRKASNMTDAVAGLAGHPRIGDVRVRGLIAGIELVEDKASKAPVDASAVAANVPHATAGGNVVIVAPPLDIDDTELDAIPRAILAALR